MYVFTQYKNTYFPRKIKLFFGRYLGLFGDFLGKSMHFWEKYILFPQKNGSSSSFLKNSLLVSKYCAEKYTSTSLYFAIFRPLFPNKGETIA